MSTKTTGDITELEKPILPDEVKQKPKKKTKAAKMDFSVQELQEKINLLFGGIAKIFKYDYPYKEKDFTTEAQALERMCTKFPFLGGAISLFDPLTFIFGLFSKFSDMKKKPQAEKNNVVQGDFNKPNVAGGGNA